MDILVIYVDSMVFGKHHMLAAIGVDSEGYKHVLGIREGASENATVARGLLEDISEGGRAGAPTTVRNRRFESVALDDSTRCTAAIT